MKTTTMHSMIMAAALVAVAGCASAQTYNAEIPMSFRAAGQVMAPGSYQIVVDKGRGHAVVTVRSQDSKSAVIAVPTGGPDAPKAWREAGAPRVSFSCVADNCTLSRLWDGRNVATYAFPVHALPNVEAQRMTVVTLALVRAR